LLNLYIVIQLAIGFVFLLSSEEKLRDSKGFADGLAAYRIVPASWTGFSSLLVIGLEGFLGVVHLTGHLLKIGLWVGLVLVVSFAVAVAVNLVRGRALPCYCFGSSESIISWATLGRLALLAFGEVLLLKTYKPVDLLSAAALPQVAYALFWSILLLVTVSWMFAAGDVVRVLKSAFAQSSNKNHLGA